MSLYDYIESIKDKRIAVIGAGVSNKPLIKLLLMSGCEVTVCDKKTPDKIDADDLELIGYGAKYKLGSDYLLNLDFDIIFRTPGLMPFDINLLYARQKGSVITSEMEVFFALCPCKTIAVTGSDGKTTTSTIISEILRAEGYSVHLGGNIGKPLLCDIPFIKKDDVAVLELSSFQLHSMMCKPNISVITNISPNHLDKHKTYSDYVQAKKQIFTNQGIDDITVLNNTDAESLNFITEIQSQIRLFGTRSDSVSYYVNNDVIFKKCGDTEEAVMSVNDIALPGKHNIYNYLAAFTAVDSMVDIKTCVSIAKQFSGVEHRLELVRDLDGVKYINDSIGTSPTRTIAGIHAFSTKPIIILGGYDKELSFSELGDEVCKYCKSAVVTGATAEKILSAIHSSVYYNDSDIIVKTASDLRDALTIAKSIAKQGDIVMLSPACAAFDCFRNFEERGRYFKQLVLEL